MALYKIKIEIDEVQDSLIRKKAEEGGITEQEFIEQLVQSSVVDGYLRKLVCESLNAELAKIEPSQALQRLKSFT